MVGRASANRPFKFGAKDRREFIVHDGEITIRAQNDANGNVVYLGFAKVGASTSDAVWQIAYFTWDANNALLTKTWPQNSEGNPSTEYEFAWDSRAGYVYA